MKLPIDVSGQALVRALLRKGFIVTRQRGSHIVLRRDHPHARVVVPNHNPIRPGTLRQILNEAGLTVQELIELL
ncbi:MAG TPA: type II toxin-antitoxin system HicA family toxin [Bryobacteraceae bacterium]|jgi:predicted RNA binding protein YcfA (HicA-like mRNA interferase family)